MARVGIDLDGVCYDFTGVFRDYMVKMLGWLHDTSKIDKWDFYLDWGMSRGGFLNYCARSVIEGYLFTKGDPLPGTKEALDALREAGHTIVFITDRASICKEAKNATKDWLRKHELCEFDDELHFSGDKTIAPTDYFIDDRLENYDALNAVGVRVYLWNRPWNQDDTECWGSNGHSSNCKRRRRVSSWDEFLDRVSAEERPLGKVEETRVVSSTGGEKGSKLARFDLIPMNALWKVAELYGKGAEKYDDWNWRKGYDFKLSQAAMWRHYALWAEGQKYDPETNCHHLAAVVFHALSLMVFEDEHPEFDTRFRKDDAA